MKKLSISASVVAVTSLLAFTSITFAAPNNDRVSAQNINSDMGVVIPQNAVEVAHNVFDLGSAIDPTSGKLAHGYAIVHPK